MVFFRFEYMTIIIALVVSLLHCWYLAETFSNVSDKHEHHTRAQTHQNLTLVKPKNNQLKLSFNYSGALNWNNLNRVIRNATSLNIFKSAFLKSHFNH